MAESRSTRKKDIEALLAERKKFEAWLAQLEGRRGAAAAHVFERVHADYTTRLESVREQLAGMADGLKEMLTDLEARLADEQRAVSEKSDARAEAELRALVGEFDDRAWDATRGELDGEIATLRKKFDATERELAHLKELLDSILVAPTAPRASVLRAAVESVEGDLAQAGRDAAASDGDVDDPSTPASADESTNAGVVESVGEAELAPEGDPAAGEPMAVAETGDSAGAEQLPNAEASIVEIEALTVDLSSGALDPEPAATESPAVAPPASAAFDELAFLRSVAATPTNPRGSSSVGARSPAAPAAKRGSAASQPLAESPSGPREPAVPPAGDDLPASPLGAPTPRTSQAVRTLKCQECGTLNFPTEWYCERCGGELAAF
ncbi:MAG TPA: hypothetical protein VG916_11725 [Gemmatimonadaceae bacterium]|nr:hypothetical protein [Gemmatimonadaceae bacterium]